MSKDYYKILNVDKNDSPEEIKTAFRKLAHQYHPDKPGGDEKKFKEINEAYQVLSNPEKRKRYDQYGSTFEEMGGFGPGVGWEDFMRAARSGGATQGFSFDFEDLGLGDIFSDFFGFSGERKKRTRRGEDIHLVMTIDFKEAVFGVEKTIKLNKLVKCKTCQGTGIAPDSKIVTCPVCQGSGQVQKVHSIFFGQFATTTICQKCGGEGKFPEKRCKKCQGQGVIHQNVSLKIKIPSGIDNGEMIRLNQQGNVGKRGALAGDLYLTLRVKTDSYFRRDGYDIFTEQEITFSQAVLGDKIKVRILTGEVVLKIPSGTKSGQVFKLKNAGIPYLRSRGQGDHLVKVKIMVPKELTKDQRKILEDLKKKGL